MNLSEINILLLYALFFLLALGLSVLVNSLLLKFSLNLGIRNHSNNEVRWNKNAKPSLGGISFFIIFLLSLSFYSVIYTKSIASGNNMFFGFIMAATLGFLAGLYDDAYNTRVWLKLGSQVGCGLILLSTGTYIQLFDSQLLNYAFTLLWVIGIMNSINLLDNMDGITTVVSIFILLTALVSVLIGGDFYNPYFLVMTGILASLGGFLVYNWNPSRLFMGDTGSQFLGVILSAVGIHFFWNLYPPDSTLVFSRQFSLVLVVFAIPIIDTTTVVIKRLAKGTSPFVGGRDHTTHHLSYLGLSDRQVALVFLLLSGCCTATGLFIILGHPHWTPAAALLYLGFFLVLFSSLFYIAVRNT